MFDAEYPSMDLTLDATQAQIADALDRMLARASRVQQSIRLVEEGAYDFALHRELEDAGFLDLPLTQGAGTLEAAIVVEAVARRPGVVSVGASGLVYPCLTGASAQGPVALARSLTAPIRFAPFVRQVLVDNGDEALLATVEPGTAEPVDSGRAGWSLGRFKADIGETKSLGAGSGEQLRNWWRVALALESAGAMRGAVDKTVQYVKERIQFGRPIGSFQAIQHRLAQLCVQVEGTRWLAFKAAYDRADPVSAAAAASWAAATAPLVFRETQQMHGAMGFTREYPLHAWTMRLPALQRELGGLMSHARALTESRWGGLE